jgi:hypothetical protein
MKQLTKPPYKCRTLFLHTYIYTHTHIYTCVCVRHVVTLHSKKLPNKIYLDYEALTGQHSTYATGWLILRPLQWYQGHFPPKLSGQDIRLTIQLHPVPNFRKSSAIPSFHHMPSWCNNSAFIVVFKLSLCCRYGILSSGYFPGV